MEKILKTLKENPIEVGHWLGLDKLTDINNEWLKMFLYSREDVTLQGHRGSYKTTTLGLFFALHIITRPNETIRFFRKTDEDVKEILRLTRKILEDESTKWWTQQIYGVPVELKQSSMFEIHTNLCTRADGQSQLVGSGIGGSVTGKHADIVVTDDIVNVKDRVSRAERERTKLAYMELQNIKNRGGRFINTGTPWHKEDCFSIMPNIRKFDCYSTGLMTREEIQALRSTMSDSLFAANYELKHIADADALFKEPHWTDEYDMLIGGVGHIDASYGGSDGSAYTAINRLDDGTIVALGKRWDKHIDECINEIEVIHNNYQLGSIYNELNADKGYLAKNLTEQGFMVNSYHEGMNKYVKIATYLKKYWDKIYWLDQTDPEYMQEILDYTEFAEHDDSPDSIASLLRETEQTAQFVDVRGSFF